MNCPDCHCPRGEPLTVATNSLVTRCQHAFHAVSPARPDDFATETAKGTTPPHPTHHGAAEALVCLGCGKAECSPGEANCSVCLRQLDDGHCRTEACPRFDGESTWHENSPRDLPDPQTYKRSDTTLEFPYSTPIPTAHDGSTGWVWCATCESPRPVSGHECAKPGERPLGALVSLTLELEYAQAEAEAAHSLLCALALDHGLERFRRHFGGVEGYCHEAEECVFCGAARGGGR